MTLALPASMRAHLGAPSLAALWTIARQRLERSGHQARGSVTVSLDDDGADRLAGLLGRPIAPGNVRVTLADLDIALRRSAAARGLVSVVAELTGSALHDRPAERATRDHAWREVWQSLDDDLTRIGLAAQPWVEPWVRWLHASGVVTRLGVDRARVGLRAAVAVLAVVLPSDSITAPRALGELASSATGSAHGLDDGRTTTALVLRAASIAHGLPPPASSAERRLLWQQLGVETDVISGTVLVWALRPPGADPWSAMMNDRADLGLVTHLTGRELRGLDTALTRPDAVVHVCENPQVLQACADAGVQRPMACVSGNPSSAGLLLLAQVRARYHGDFDWPGIAITRRLIATGASPWRMGADDYARAVESSPAHARLPLTGRQEPTPWDEKLADLMDRVNVVVHEESLVDVLLGDLR